MFSLHGGDDVIDLKDTRRSLALCLYCRVVLKQTESGL